MPGIANSARAARIEAGRGRPPRPRSSTPGGIDRPAPAHPPVIEVVDLVKRYRKAQRNAVDGISFEVGRGEFFALLGPNGAGKTTTISILTTTLLPTGGGATIAGHDLVTEASAVRRLGRSRLWGNAVGLGRGELR